MHDANLLEDQPIAWTPTPDVIERSQLKRFMKQVGVSTWDDLYAFSIKDVGRFTEEVIKFLDIKFDPPYERVLDTTNGVEFPTWLAASRQSRRDAKAETRPVGSVPVEDEDPPQRRKDAKPTASAGLNITTMCLDRWQTDEMKDQPAVIWEGEDTATESISYADLLHKVEQCARGLILQGFAKGDAIGIHLPMLPETVVALLAINRIGAIAVPVFSGYGVEAISSRLNAVQAKALFTCDGFFRRDKFFNAFEIALQAAERSPTVKNLFVVTPKSYIAPPPEDNGNASTLLSEEEGEEMLKDFLRAEDWGVNRFRFDEIVDQQPDRYKLWEDLLTSGLTGSFEASKSEPTSAEDPLIILYTSGTTGKPKGIAHTHASFPIKAAQDMAFGTDVGRGTRISWYTDIGWMMGPWLIYGALINGATICIYDGAPDYPTPDRMWEFCAKHKVEILGISPTLIRSLAAAEGDGASKGEPPASAGGTSVDAKIDGETSEALIPDTLPPTNAGGSPFERHDLSSLRMFASTGEPWNPAPWWWLFEKVGDSKLPIINYSGGTEISGGILMGNPLLPQKPCSFPAPCPGMDVDILDENGEPVAPGEVGELVIKQPWIGMARGFWQEKERYLDTYWRRFKDIWVHGDFAMRDADGHWFILGRSDDTLKVAGKRVGPAEVESILVSHPNVIEAAVIGVPDERKGTAMVAFVVTSDKGQVTSEDGSDSSLVPRPSSLQQELKTLVAKDMGKPLAPSKIHFVSALPKTRNAKVMRRVIRSAYLGEDPGDLSALEEPKTVDEIRDLGE